MTEHKDADLIFDKGIELLNGGDAPNALKSFIESEAIYSENNNTSGRVSALKYIAHIYITTEKYEAAAEALEIEHELQKQADDTRACSITLHNLGLAYTKNSNPEKALEAFEEALQLCLNNSDMNMAAALQGNIGSNYRDASECGKALEAYGKSLEMYKNIDHIPGMADQYSNIAYIHMMQNDLKTAHHWFTQALFLYDQIGEKDKLDMVKQNIVNIEKKYKYQL